MKSTSCSMYILVFFEYSNSMTEFPPEAFRQGGIVSSFPSPVTGRVGERSEPGWGEPGTTGPTPAPPRKRGGVLGCRAMPHVKVGNVRLYYEEVGQGLPLVFVHEFAGEA